MDRHCRRPNWISAASPSTCPRLLQGYRRVLLFSNAASLEYARQRQYNSDFATRLFAARDSGILTIPYFAPDAYALSSGQPVTIPHWDTLRQKGSRP